MNGVFGEHFETVYGNSVLYLAEVHVPLVFLIDTSGSMGSSIKNQPIEKINKYFQNIPIKYGNYPEMDVIDTAIIEFSDNATVVRNFNPLSRGTWLELRAYGGTAMGEGIMLSLDKIREERYFYIMQGIRFLRPWLIMLTDGTSCDDITAAKEAVLEAQNKKKLRFMAVGITGADKRQLSELSKLPLFVDLTQISLDVFFDWVLEVVVKFMHIGGMEGEDVVVHLPAGIHYID